MYGWFDGHLSAIKIVKTFTSFAAKMQPVDRPGRVFRSPISVGFVGVNNKIVVGLQMVSFIVNMDGTRAGDTINKYVFADAFFAFAKMIFRVRVESNVADVELSVMRIFFHQSQLLLR